MRTAVRMSETSFIRLGAIRGVDDRSLRILFGVNGAVGVSVKTS